MNFGQALSQMVKGHRVRLSDWLGYWYMPYIPSTESETGAPSFNESLGLVKVFTRDGDTLDTPNIDRYKDRDDWEVVTQIGWSFDMALRFLKNGKRVERQGWNGKGMWIEKVAEGTLTEKEENYITTQYLQIKSVNGTLTPWLPSQTDLLANDWQIVSA